MRASRLAVLIPVVLTFVAAPPRADIIDCGVNISSSGSTTQVENGFWSDNIGYTLANRCRLFATAVAIDQSRIPLATIPNP